MFWHSFTGLSKGDPFPCGVTERVNEKGSVCERYARDTHYACLWLEAMALFNPRNLHLTVSARIDRMMNVYFDCDSGCRQRNASAAGQKRQSSWRPASNRMPLFSDTIDHGSTAVDTTHVEFTAHGSWPWIRNENPTQESITGARYDACLTRA